MAGAYPFGSILHLAVIKYPCSISAQEWKSNLFVQIYLAQNYQKKTAASDKKVY